MSKELSEMTLEELWRLFPIYLTRHQEDWENQYNKEAKLIMTGLNSKDIIISHIGSTAIKGIWAKPIIDILLEIPTDMSMEQMKDYLLDLGYLCMCEEEKRKDFNKGYTNNGFADHVFHLHLRFSGDNDEVYFCDYMNKNPKLAKKYEQLKLELWKEYENDRDGYTNAKGEFVRKYTQEAKIKLGKYIIPDNHLN